MPKLRAILPRDGKPDVRQANSMLNKYILRFSLSLILVSAIAFSSVQSVLAGRPAPNPEQAQFEISFMKDMIDHHAAAVEMAELCIKRAVHDELRSMCEQMKKDQTREIERMRSWLREWYDINYRPHIEGEARQMIRHLADDHRGAKFEIHFMHMMIMHHSMAIEMAQTCLTQAYHERLLSLCETIIATQTAEIEQMQAWLCEWYEHCDDGMHKM